MENILNLENILKLEDVKVVENIEKQGQELYFNDKPSYDVIKILKENFFKWHNSKKCWYRSLKLQGKTRNIDTKTTKTDKEVVKNEFGVKIGDIFVYTWGYEQTNQNFYQVVKLNGKKGITIKAISSNTIEQDSYSNTVEPNKDNFINDMFIKDNENGDKKILNNKYGILFNIGNGSASLHKVGTTYTETWGY